MTTVPFTARPRPTLFGANEPLTSMLGADCGTAAPKKLAGISSKAVVKVSLVINRILVFRYFQGDQSCFDATCEPAPKPTDGVTAASWPQAAKISRPRGLRTKV